MFSREVTFTNNTDRDLPLALSILFRGFDGPESVIVYPSEPLSVQVACDNDMDCYQKFCVVCLQQSLVPNVDFVMELKSI